MGYPTKLIDMGYPTKLIVQCLLPCVDVEGKQLVFPFKRNWVLLSLVDARGKNSFTV